MGISSSISQVETEKAESTQKIEIKEEGIKVPRNRTGKKDKFVCHMFLPKEIAECKGFRAPSYLIGKGGANMKAIHERTQSKLRMRGVGSGFKENNDKEGDF